MNSKENPFSLGVEGDERSAALTTPLGDDAAASSATLEAHQPTEDWATFDRDYTAFVAARRTQLALPELPPTVQVEMVASRLASIQHFTHELAAVRAEPEPSPRALTTLFLKAFSGGGTDAKLRLLAQVGLLDQIVPEYGRNKGLEQDPRLHGKETVGEHLIAASGMMDELIEQLPPPQTPRFAELLRLAAFFHDIGKNSEPHLAPEKNEGNKLGYLVKRTKVDKATGQVTEAIGFYGHAQYGSTVFDRYIAPMSQENQPEIGFSVPELTMVQGWIEHHMRAVEATYQPKRTQEEITDWLIDESYPPTVRNARISQADAVRGTLALQSIELIMAQDEDRLAHLQAWREIIEIIEEKLPLLELLAKEESTVRLVSGFDLVKLNVPEAYREPLLRQLTRDQAAGRFSDRPTALTALVEYLHEQLPALDVDRAMIQELAGGSAVRLGTARFENLRMLKQETITDGPQPYEVLTYETEPFQEMYPDTPIEELYQKIMSGNYPLLQNHLAERNVVVDESFRSRILEAGFVNLVQLETLIQQTRSFGAEQNVLEIAKTHSPHMLALEIRRTPIQSEATKLSILFENGYQATTDHVGVGVIHVGEQRCDELRQFFRRGEESDEAMLERFFKDAVIQVTGSADCVIPSDYGPERFRLLTGPIRNMPGQFATVIIDCESAERARLVTTLYAPDAKAARRNLKSSLKRLHEKAGVTGPALAELVERANQLLSQHGIELIAVDELIAKAPKPKKSESAPKRRTFKDELIGAGYQPERLGSLMRVLGPLNRQLNELSDERRTAFATALANSFPPLTIDGASTEQAQAIATWLTDQLNQSSE